MGRKRNFNPKRYEKYVENYIKEINQLEGNSDFITQGLSPKEIAQNENSYEDFLGRVQKESKRVRTNEHGITLSKNKYWEVKELENNIALNNFEILQDYAENKSVSQIEKMFLQGYEVRGKSDSENLKLPHNLGSVDIFNNINSKKNYDKIIGKYEMDLEHNSIEDITDLNGFEFDRLYLSDFLELKKITNHEYIRLVAIYKELNTINKAHIQKDLDHLMQAVESATSKQYKYKDDFYLAIKDIIFADYSKDYNLI